MATDQTTQSILDNVTAGLDHFDPFQGFVDDDKQLNIRYGFRLGNINFLVNESSMSEVVMKPYIYSIPNTPTWIQGLINLRGILVPVFDIKQQIGQSNNEDKNSDILFVLDKGERAFATYIDALPDSINIDNNDFIKTSLLENTPEILKKHVIETFEANKETWLELDFDSFIKDMTKDYSNFEND